MPIVIGGSKHRSSSDRTCCNSMDLVTATWVIAVGHLIIVGYIWLMGALYLLGVLDYKEHTRFDCQVGFAGTLVNNILLVLYIQFSFRFGESALIVAATIWLIFIILLILGLRQSRPNFILAHLISCVCH